MSCPVGRYSQASPESEEEDRRHGGSDQTYSDLGGDTCPQLGRNGHCRICDHGRRHYSAREVVSRNTEGSREEVGDREVSSGVGGGVVAVWEPGVVGGVPGVPGT